MDSQAEVNEIRNKLRMMKFPAPDEIINAINNESRALLKQRSANETLRSQVQEYTDFIMNYKRLMKEYENDDRRLTLESEIKAFTNKQGVLTGDLRAEEEKHFSLEEEVASAKSKHLSKSVSKGEIKKKTLEDKLSVSIIKYNKCLSKLSDMRDKIDEVRKERNAFKEAAKNAKKEAEDSEKMMSRLIATSNETYSERDRAKLDLAQLRAAEKDDQQNYEVELSRLKQKIEGQFAGQKMVSPPSIPSVTSQVGSVSDQQEELVRKTEDLNYSITKSLELTQMKDLKSLFIEYDRLESNNFSLFNCVVEEEAIRNQTREELSEAKKKKEEGSRNDQMTEDDQREEIVKMEREIGDLDNQIQKFRTQRTETFEKVDRIKAAIRSIFTSLGCSWEGCPSGREEVAPANSEFILSQIGEKMAGLMEELRIKARTIMETEKNDDISEANISEVSSEKSSEIQAKSVDMTKPLSIEEVRSMIV